MTFYKITLLLLFSLLQTLLHWNVIAFETESLLRYSYDSWCIHQCATLTTCLERFGQSYVDLQLQLRFNQIILHRYGQTLEYEIYMGETISQQTFEKQFVWDLSSAIGISPCRIYVTNIEPKYHSDNDETKSFTLLIVSFRWISVEIEAIRLLTSLVQEPDSSIYQGQVSLIECMYIHIYILSEFNTILISRYLFTFRSLGM